MFLWIALKAIKDRNRSANAQLALIMAITLLLLTGRLLFYRIEFLLFFKIACLVDSIVFAIGALTLNYLNHLLYGRGLKGFKYHLVPAVLHAGFALWFITLTQQQIGQYQLNNTLAITFFFIELLAILSFGVYLWISYRNFKGYTIQEELALSYQQKVRQFMQGMLGVWLVFLLLWVISFVNSNFLNNALSFFNYNTLWIVISASIYMLGYISLKQSEVLKMPNRKAVEATTDRARLNPNQIEQLKKRLSYFMIQEQVYANSELSLNLLAQKLNTSTNNLSWLLNRIYKQSFYDFINAHRVQAVVDAIRQGQHQKMTLLALAFEAGFKSKSTFNKAFKKETGQSPSAFIKTNKVA